MSRRRPPPNPLPSNSGTNTRTQHSPPRALSEGSLVISREVANRTTLPTRVGRDNDQARRVVDGGVEGNRAPVVEDQYAFGRLVDPTDRLP